MARRLEHRGPDGFSIHYDGAFAFGAGRLAIIDLSAPAGPLFNEDHCIAVAFNGEIYNYRALRAELERLGHRFATSTDTEVIVHGYESWGIDVLNRLDGMFALCIWDKPNQRFFLARDRLGEKPLYYAQVDGEFIFASESKALFEHPSLPRAVNKQALLQYLALGYVNPPMTMFDGISKLHPGSWLMIDKHSIQQERYWQPAMDTLHPMSYTEAKQKVRDSLIEAVEMRLMSDVPVGALLSGGLDSTTIVSIMRRALGKPVQTITVGFDMETGSKGDHKFNVDARYAALAAQHLQTDHHAITIKQDESLSTLLPHLIYGMDEPVAEQAIFQTVYVSALARHLGIPVLLTGDCGDELFAGYSHFRADNILERYLQLPKLLRDHIVTPLFQILPERFDLLHKLAKKSQETDWTARYLGWKRIIALEQFPTLLADDAYAQQGYDTLNTTLRPILSAPKTRHFADRLAYAGLVSWIAEDSNMRVDKMSMQMSTELRAPFEDHHLVDLALRIPI